MRLCRLRQFCWTALFLSALPVTGAYAAGLGALNLQSALGAPLRASIPLLGHPRLDGAHCISAKLASLDGAQLAITSAKLESNAQASVIRLRTERGINEPVVNIAVNIGCGVSVHRQYQVLLDPVGLSPAVLPPQTAPAPEAARSAPAPHVAAKKKPRHSHAVRTPSPPVAGAPIRTPRHAVAHPYAQKEAPEAKPLHSILRLGPTDSVTVYRAPRLHLRLSDHLTLPPAPEAVPPVPASGPVAPAAAQRDQELERRAQRLLDSLEAEAASLRAEAARIKQENNAYRSALEGKHNDSLNWIKGLGLLLLACVAAVGWLLWRVMTMKQNAPHPWHELFSNQEANTIDSALMAGNTEFSTTALDLSELRTEQFDTVTSSLNGQTLSDSLAQSGTTLDMAVPATAQPVSDAPAAVLPEPAPAMSERHVRSRRPTIHPA
jgi:Tfp pilus assembly protein FimV